MEVGFGRGVGRKGNGMMRERMKTEEKMRWNTMTLESKYSPVLLMPTPSGEANDSSMCGLKPSE